MSESNLPNPNPQPQEDPIEQPQSSNSTDPNQFDHVELDPSKAIAAEPISMVAPEDCWHPPPKKAAATPKKRTAEEASVRPSWLPEDWKMVVRVRTSGATAGTPDRYYFDPSGNRKFRSKIEVLHFLETGNKLKRKPNSEGDAAPSGSPMSQKQKKSGVKGKNPLPQVV